MLWFLVLAFTSIFIGSGLAAGLLPYGSREGMSVTIVEMQGIDTVAASIKVEHTRANAKAFCVGYVQTNDEQCVERTLSEVRLNDVIKANCKTGQFTNLSGSSLRFAGVNAGEGHPKYRILQAGSSEPLDGTMASGYEVNLQQFQALCPATVAQAGPAPSSAAGSYIGRWYDGTDRSVCKEQPGTADGLLVYTEKEAMGLESWCRIAGKKVTGDRTDLTLRCRGEGYSSTSQESLQVVGGRLQRTVIEGRKRYVFTYNRCP